MKSKLFLQTVLVVAFAAILILNGCDSAIESDYHEQLVVGAFLYANEPIDSIVIHRTTPFGAYYDDLSYAVEDAQVIVTVDGVQHTLLPGSMKGRYYLPSTQLIVQGGKTYDLSIVAPNSQYGGNHSITATTTVPMPIHLPGTIDSIRGRSFVFDTANVLSFAYLITAIPTDESDKRYLLSVTARDTTFGMVHILRFDDSTNLTKYSEVASGPAIAVTAQYLNWYGPNTITMYAIDSNWWDYQRQVPPNGRGTTFQPTLNHIQGGIGIFGSAARDTVSVFIKRKE
ncbi:MAG: DUF4249 family protein [bacterium]